MVKRRTLAQWQALVDEFEASDETARAFCLERGLSEQYFGKRRQLLRRSAFAQIQVPARPERTSILVRRGEITIECNADTPPEWVAKLLSA